MENISGSDWDIAVAGAGMGGLSAALSAAELGAKVLVLEKSARPGGNANLAAGMFLGSSDLDGLRQYIPGGEIALQKAHCAGFLDAVAWLENHGLPFGPAIEFGDFRVIRPMAAGVPGNRAPFMRQLAARAEAKGAAIAYETPMGDLRRSGPGFEIATKAGTVRAGAVILATGGFQGNRGLLERYLGAEAAGHLRIRSVPECAGDGLEAALGLGARESENMSFFYGHTMADGDIPMADFQPMTPYFARNGLLLSGAGRRFVDESSSLLEEANPQAACRQPGGRFYLVFDQEMYDSEGETRSSHAAAPRVDWLGRAAAMKLPVFAAASIGELAALLGEEGLPVDNVIAELEAYNDAIGGDGGRRLDPPRAGNAYPLAQPPFYALRCVAGITATCGGIRVDADGRVQGGGGRAIAGLYAAGVDAGGVFDDHYGGFLGWALTSGRASGRAAVKAGARINPPIRADRA